MGFGEILRLVWINLWENKVKMMMTSLGIIVGAATIVLVIAIGKGGQADVADQFRNLNAGAIEVSIGTGVNVQNVMPDMGGGFAGGAPPAGFFPATGGGMPNFGGGMPNMGGNDRSSSRTNRRTNTTTTRMTTEDVSDLVEMLPSLSLVTILQTGDSTVLGGSLEEDKTVTVAGVLPNYQDVSNLKLFYGSFFEESDTADYVCVLGFDLAAELFTYPAYAVGDYLAIDGKNYEILGVLEQMGSVSSGLSPDNAVFIPYASAEKYVFGTTQTPKLAALASDVEEVPLLMEDIETILKENHPNAFFDVTDAGSAMEAASGSANTLALLLLAVASIVFIVGGIGIMNVLFVSVQERTPEIGILKAIGCSQSTILTEFLLEANILSVVGGIAGVGVSYGLMPVVELLGMRVEPSVSGAAAALAFAVLTGTLFGFYPAWKASRLVPIQALQLN